MTRPLATSIRVLICLLCVLAAETALSPSLTLAQVYRIGDHDFDLGAHMANRPGWDSYKGLGKNPAWGDQGNGTYINPILAVDFSDPDVIRVDDTYYMVASDFHFMGMQLLSSHDMVNWKYTAQLYDRLDFPGWEEMSNYAGGSWAPSIRYHDGKFYVFFCTPKEGLFMTCAQNPEGPWSPLNVLHEGPGWEDPCPFWDEDGSAYLGHSLVGAGPIIIHRMSPDGTKLLDDGVEVYRGPVAEGTKIHKKDRFYYFSIPEGGVGGGNQVVLRSASIYGPYDKRLVLESGSTNINGPHQGAIVDTPDGKWYFYHFQETPTLGRVVHLQPMWWQDGWPVIGVDIDRNGVGEPVHSWDMPVQDTKRTLPATSDEFASPVLGLQWQFNHNPVPGGLSLTERPGHLVMHAKEAPSFVKARNTISQKLVGFKGSMSAKILLDDLEDGTRTGIASMGAVNFLLGVRQEGRQRILYVEDPSGKDIVSLDIKSKSVHLGMSYNATKGTFQFCYSLDGKAFTDIGDTFQNGFGHWKGVRPAIFCYSTRRGGGGSAAVDYFRYDVQ